MRGEGSESSEGTRRGQIPDKFLMVEPKGFLEKLVMKKEREESKMISKVLA